MLHTTTVGNGKVNGGIVTGTMVTPVPAQSPQPADSTTGSGGTPTTATKRVKERENLRNIIAQWNANRLDLFEISEPNEDLEFYGVMRFYFQDAGQKVATKCMRISSTAGTVDVISNLIEKFRPDIRMLSVPEYALYEIHENGEERKLGDEEMPLLVQLNWHKDDREGRFLLRRMDEKTYLPGFGTENSNFLNRKLSKREKKEKKKREKKEKAAGKANGDKSKDSLAEKLYTELPETSFTRSISNPEAVMRRRRQQKLEKKLQQFSQEGGADAGGTLRIFGESINQDVPYKTILLSTRDTAAFAVKEILEKYGKEKEDSAQYCLVQIVVPFMNGEAANLANGTVSSKSLPDANIREYILDDDDCPLIIERSHLKSRGVLTFHIRRRPPDYQPRKRKKMPGQFVEPVTPEPIVHGKNLTSGDHNAKMLPYLVEVNPNGSDIARTDTAPRRHYLYMNVTEVGSEVSNNNSASDVTPNASKTPSRNSLQLFGPNVLPRHCVIAHTEGIITVTPCNREAETFVNGTRIYETTILKHGMLVRFGKIHTFKFLDELTMRRHSQLSSGAIIGQHFPQQQPQPINISQATTNGSDFGAGGGNGPAPYETTFDADGKVETSSAGKGVEPGSPFVNSGSLQRHHTVGSLPRSASDTGSNHNGSSDLVSNPIANAAAQRNSTAGGASVNSNTLIRKGDNILPAILEVWEEIEDLFLNMIIKRVDPNQVQFKLCITYTLYMVTRYRASTYFKPEITPEARANRLIAFCIKYSHLIQQTINENHREQSFLAFWLANSSELLHFLKNDRHLSAFTFDSQDILAEAVQLAFSCLVSCQHHELQDALSTFSEDIVDQSDQSMSAMTTKVLNVLSNSMQLLRRFRVNAALTIQLFSQLFHFINMWLFNKVIGTPSANFCSRQFGLRFKNCLVQIELWAEKQGLELAAECHLSRIVQTAQFLQAPKNSTDELGALVANFYKLNSVQLRALFERYKPMSDEVPFSAEHIESVIKMARSTTDELILKEGREIRLEEETDLQLPFLLPEDGYSCDIVRGIPAGLQEFVQTLVQARVCNLTIQPTASGCWTIYFINFQPEPIGPMVTHQDFLPPSSANDETFKKQQQQQMEPASSVIQKNVPVSTPNNQFGPNAAQQQQNLMSQSAAQFIGPKGAMGPGAAQTMLGQKPANMMPNMGYPGYNSLRGMPEPEVQVLKLQKSNNGMGLSIVAARGTNQNQLGIYIKSVVKGGAADLDGRLEAGDQLLKVDGHSLIGITQERAAELMTQTGPIVTLEVAKQGALFHGLGGILTQQSQSASAILNKNVAAMRARDMQRFNQDFGPHRMNGQHIPASMQFSPQHSRIPVNAAGFPTYNSMPGPLTYNQMAANYRNQMQNGSSMPLNYNNNTTNNNMRPDSQLSYNSQTNPLNSPLAGPSNRINMSTASLPAVNQQQPPPPHMYEERHYQNIQLYQVNSGANNPISNTANANQLPKLSPNIPPHQNLIGNNNTSLAARPMVHGSHSSLQQQQQQQSDPNLQPPSRPVSAIVTSREQEQIFTSSVAFTSPGTPTSVTSRQPNGPEFFNYPQPQQQAQPNYQFDPAQQVQQHQLDQQMRHQRDLMRQEAKMEEIREELRRREDRMQHQPSPYLGTIPRGMSLSNTGTMVPPNSVRPVRFVSQQTLANGQNQMMNGQNQLTGTLRHPAQLNMNRTGPPAPAPKPARPMNFSNNNQNSSSNNQQPATQVSYRYGPSGYPPVASSKSSNGFTNNKNDIPSSGVVSPSPWEREEKEKELQQKIEDTRKTRDEEIKYLESVSYRNTKHEERLRKLILEREFQRRADEHLIDEEEEEDDAMLERADNRERMLSLKQDIERSRQRRMDMRYVGDTKLNKTLEEQEERLKLLRLEEEATQQAEERLLQEAKKRQEDEMKVSKGILKQPNNLSNNGVVGNDGDIPPPLPKSPPPMESANQRLDRLLQSTASKSNINEINEDSGMNSMPVRSGVLKNPNLYNGDGPTGDRSVKKVSWNDNPSTAVLNESENSEDDADEEEEEEEEEDEDHNEDRFSLQDIDDVLGNQGGGSKDWLNNYVSGNTPGVIGSQEVYNDPRKRIEAERLKSNQSQTSSDKVPEKLSFQEKMKMFAKSTDSLEDGPLRNKVKTSKAQREIEGVGSNGSPNGLYEDAKN